MYDEIDGAEFWYGLGVYAAGESGDELVEAFEALRVGSAREV